MEWMTEIEGLCWEKCSQRVLGENCQFCI